MAKRKKPEPKPEKEPADITVDKSETLAGMAPTPAAIAHAESGPREQSAAAVSATSIIICPTCGTWRMENRCEVCGHQEHDT